MSLVNDIPRPSFIFDPSQGSENNDLVSQLNRMQGETGQASFPFTRSTSKYTVNKNGLITEASANIPAIDYDSDGKNLGYLAEPASTNEALNSADLTQTAWVKTNGTASFNQVGIDGTPNSASLFTATSANATALQSFTDATSEARTYSVFVKRSTGTGAVEITIDGGSTWTAITSNLSDTGFYRADVTNTGTNPEIGVRVVTSGDAVIIDGNQIENGSVPTSYIPTKSSTANRTADSLEFTGAGDLIGQTSGVLYASVNLNGVSEATDRYLLSLNDNSSSERIAIIKRTNNIRLLLVDSGTTEFFTPSSSTYSGYARILVKYSKDDFEVFINGSSTNTETSGGVPTMNQINIGTSNSNGELFLDHIASVALWNNNGWLTTTLAQDMTRI